MRLNKSLALSEIDEAVWHSINCESILKIIKQQIIIFPVSQEEQSNMQAMCFLRSHETRISQDVKIKSAKITLTCSSQKQEKSFCSKKQGQA